MRDTVAKGGRILGSLDNVLADIVEGDWNFYGGSALTVSGCQEYCPELIEAVRTLQVVWDPPPAVSVGRLSTAA